MAESKVDATELSDSGREAIARSLQWGGILSFVLLTLGIALNMAGAGRRFGDACLHTGLISLMATPVLRIIVACGLFARIGNRRFMTYCLFALAVVSASVVLGLLRIGR